MKPTLVTKEYGKSIKNQKGEAIAGGFKYETIPQSQFEEWGIPTVVAANLAYIVDAFLRTHPLKVKYMADVEAAKKDDAEGQEAKKATQGVYTYDWLTMPKGRSSSKWGDNACYVQAAKKLLKDNGIVEATEDQLKVAVEHLANEAKKNKAKFAALFAKPE